MKWLKNLFKPKRSARMKKHIQLASSEIEMELELNLSPELKAKLEKALIDLYMVAADCEVALDKPYKTEIIDEKAILDFTNRVTLAETRLRQELETHPVAETLDGGVLKTYIEQSLEPLQRLSALLFEKVKGYETRKSETL